VVEVQEGQDHQIVTTYIWSNSTKLWQLHGPATGMDIYAGGGGGNEECLVVHLEVLLWRMQVGLEVEELEVVFLAFGQNTGPGVRSRNN
jgi:hypothetical protein